MLATEPPAAVEVAPQNRFSVGAGASTIIGGTGAEDSSSSSGVIGNPYIVRFGYGYVFRPGLELGGQMIITPSRPTGVMVLPTFRGFLRGQNAVAEIGYALHAGFFIESLSGNFGKPWLGLCAAVSFPEIRVWFSDNIGMQLDAGVGLGVGRVERRTLAFQTLGASGSLIARF